MNQTHSVIDVGCGTGRFSFSVYDKCKSVLGIDLSKRNIDRANLLLAKIQNQMFLSIIQVWMKILNEGKSQFDYAMLTYVIHEVNEAGENSTIK